MIQSRWNTIARRSKAAMARRNPKYFPWKSTFIPALALATASLAVAAPRTWTTRDGRTFEAELAAADGLRATFGRGEKPDFVVVPFARLVPADVEEIRRWRADWRKPLVVPSRLAPWPAMAEAPAGDVRTGGESGAFTYDSANFHVTSDMQLPAAAANDIVRVLEATRAALIAMPLGLLAGGEREPYEVAMFRDSNGYDKAGGQAGSGGYYDHRSQRMLLLLPNLGIGEKAGTLRLDYARNIFILKHEATHQLMARWHRGMPMWASEGIAEFVASLPYADGRYALQNPGAGLRDYLLKWRGTPAARAIRLIPPARLMAMREDDWNAALSRQEAYDLYNSAALLAYDFIQQDGGTPMAGFLNALRHHEDEAAAENTWLLHGKTRDSLAKEIIALGAKLGVEVMP